MLDQEGRRIAGNYCKLEVFSTLSRTMKIVLIFECTKILEQFDASHSAEIKIMICAP